MQLVIRSGGISFTCFAITLMLSNGALYEASRNIKNGWIGWSDHNVSPVDRQNFTSSLIEVVEDTEVGPADHNAPMAMLLGFDSPFSMIDKNEASVTVGSDDFRRVLGRQRNRMNAFVAHRVLMRFRFLKLDYGESIRK